MRYFTTKNNRVRAFVTLFALLMSAGMWAQETCAPDEHEWGEWQEWAPTCTTSGMFYRECTKCEEWDIGEDIPPLGHMWGDWIVTKKPTCIYNGRQKHVCERCGDYDTATIPPLGHDYDDDNVCKRCGYELGKVKLANMGDNEDVIYGNVGSVVDVTLVDRTLKGGHWNSLSLPFALSAEQIATSPLAGAVIRTLTDFSNDGTTMTFKFSDVTEMEANMPYIVWIEGESIVNPVFEDVKIEYDWGGTVTLEGIWFRCNPCWSTLLSADDRRALFLQNDNLYYPTADVRIGSCRAYFYLREEAPIPADIKFVIDFGDERTTEIEKIENGELKIENEGWWTLDGRKLQDEPTEKGIYIVNGKKVVIQ